MSWKRKGHVFIGLVFLLINSSLSSIIPIVIGSLFDNMSGQTPLKSDTIWAAFIAASTSFDHKIAILTALTLTTFILGICRGVCLEFVAEGLIQDVRDQLQAKIVNKPLQFFDEQEKDGQSLNQIISSDCTLLRDALTTNFASLLRSIVILSISFAIMCLISYKLTLVLFIPIPIFIIIMQPMGNQMQKISRERHDKNNDANSWSEENINNILTVKSFGNEQFSHLIQRVKLKELHRKGIQNAFLTSMLVSFFLTFPWIMIIVVLWQGNQLHEVGDISAGEFIAFLLLSIQTGFCLSNFKPIQSQIVQAVDASNRIFNIILEDEKIEPSIPNKVMNSDRTQNELFNNNKSRMNNNSDNIKQNLLNKVSNQKKYVSMSKGEIEFIDVKFWQRKENVVFDNLNFKIESGKSVAIVGGEGSGKKTLLYLIQRFQDVKGTIKINRQDIKDQDTYSLHKHIGQVPYDPQMFTGSIKFNVYQPFEHKDDNILQLMDKQNIEDHSDFSNQSDNQSISKDRQYEIDKYLNLTKYYDICNMQEGEDKLLGDNQITLSGGDRLKLAIARVLVNNPKIVCIDERNPSLDSNSDHNLAQIMQNLMKNKEFTTIVIADRVSTVKAADEVLFLSNGNVEKDTHDNFMKKSNRYKTLISEMLKDDIKTAIENGISLNIK